MNRSHKATQREQRLESELLELANATHELEAATLFNYKAAGKRALEALRNVLTTQLYTITELEARIESLERERHGEK